MLSSKTVEFMQKHIGTLRSNIEFIQEMLNIIDGKPNDYIVEVGNVPVCFDKEIIEGRVTFSNPQRCHILRAETIKSLLVAQDLAARCKNDAGLAGEAKIYRACLERDMQESQTMLDNMIAYVETELGVKKLVLEPAAEIEKSATVFNEDAYNEMICRQSFGCISGGHWISEAAWEALEGGNFSMFIADLQENCDNPDVFRDFGLCDITVHEQALALAQMINKYGF